MFKSQLCWPTVAKDKRIVSEVHLTFFFCFYRHQVRTSLFGDYKTKCEEKHWKLKSLQNVFPWTDRVSLAQHFYIYDHFIEGKIKVLIKKRKKNKLVFKFAPVLFKGLWQSYCLDITVFLFECPYQYTWKWSLKKVLVFQGLALRTTRLCRRT